jgi:DNA (cytosine-5)-methyltransferase 1
LVQAAAPVSAYYSENDPFCVEWLKNLISKGLIPDGEVDGRDIRDVRPDDLRPFAQCHLFAGIAGWALALQLARWEGPVWTGSCPCQPFSAAGKRAGFADERHLWPAFFHLIRERRPPVVLGEQVGGPAGLAWLDLVQSDLEGESYAVGASDLCAAGVGAPHIRQRLWWCGYLADATVARRGKQPLWNGRANGRPAQELGRLCDADGLEYAARDGRLERRAESSGRSIIIRRGDGRMGLPNGQREASLGGFSGRPAAERDGGFWSTADWLPCRDGKLRPVEPGTFPLAHGLPARVGRLRAYGNAIVPALAAEFILAVKECMP